MLPLKKIFAAGFSFLFFTQQFVSAAPIAANALRRDSVRFNRSVELDKKEDITLSADSVKRLETFNESTDSSWRIRLNRESGTPRSLVNGRNLRVGGSESAALSFLNKNKDFLGVERKQLKLKLQRQSAVGTHFYFDQYYKNLKVETAYVKVNVDKSGNLLNYQSTFIPDISVSTKPSKSAVEAAAIAASDAAGGESKGVAELVIYPHPLGSVPTLAWKLTIIGGSAEPGKWTYYVSAEDGTILNRISSLMFADTFVANLNPVYPDFSTAKVDFNLADLNVYYFSGSSVNTSQTNASGVVTVSRSGRIFTNFTGKYFNISTQHSNTSQRSGVYMEKGTNTSSLEESINETWIDFDAVSLNTYDACATTGEYPALTAPLIENMSVGAMDIYGNITKKAYLQITSSTAPTVPLGKYIGNLTSGFNGPMVANLSTSQSLNASIVPSTETGSYEIKKMYKLCVPTAFTSGYSAISTHSAASTNRNEPQANAYYNLNFMRSFFKSLDTTNYIDLDTPLPVVINAAGEPYTANSGSGMPNAFYDVDEKVLMFGEGIKPASSNVFRNFALESAIVRHEYVHAVVDRIWPILYFGEGAAISEAVSDYFALSSLAPTSNGTPYTAGIGNYVAVTSGTTGEGVVRNLASPTVKFDAADWAENAISNNHQNGLVLSQALWLLRTGSNALAAGRADAIVWNALMFFPDSLLEFRDAMIAAADALGYSSDVSAIEYAFDYHNINYNSIITANGDIYEPNNSPDSAADIDTISLYKKELSASINPASDMDYYSIALPEGKFTATLHLPQVPQMSPARYYAFSIVLLDPNNQTVVDAVDPKMTGGQYNQATSDATISLTYDVPALASGGKGRYIIGIYKPEPAAYPAADDVNATTGHYKLVLETAKGSNIGRVETRVTDFANGLEIEFSAPINLSTAVSGTTLPSNLTDWNPNYVEAFHSVRLLDETLEVIPGTDTIDNNYLHLDTISHNTTAGTIEGKVIVQNNFIAQNYNTVHVQVLGKLRSNVSGDSSNNYRDDYGIISLGISNAVRNAINANKSVNIRNAIFNPTTGTKAKIEINAKKDGNLKVQLFTIDGIIVKTLWNGPITAAMPEFVEWDGRNERGTMVASGVYLLRLNGAGIDKQIKKIVVVK